MTSQRKVRSIGHVSPPKETRTSQHYPTPWGRVSVELICPATPRYRTTEYPGICCSVNALMSMKKALRLTIHRMVGNPKTEDALYGRNLVADEISRATSESQRRNPVYGTSRELFHLLSPIT